MTPPRDPDSGKGRVRRSPSISDTVDEADERAQAAAAIIERDVREGIAVERPEMATPRARTPAEESLRRAIDEVRRLQPEWHVAEQVARALDELADEVAAERADRLAVDEAKARAGELEAARQSWRAPLWKVIKAAAGAVALSIAIAAVKALIDYGDARRAAVQQADVISGHTTQLREQAVALDLERAARIAADADQRAAQAADHAVLSLFAARAGLSLPLAPINP